MLESQYAKKLYLKKNFTIDNQLSYNMNIT